MITLKELDDWLKDIRDLTLDVSICVTNGRRIAIDKYTNEKKLKEAGFFYHYQLQQVFILSIQLCKILTDNRTQKRNVFRLFSALETQEYDNELKDRLNSEDEYLAKDKDDLINEVNRLRKLVDNKADLIKRVKEVRDKAYAHYDPDRAGFGPSLLDYQELVNLSEEIYNGLHLKLFGSTMFFKHTIPWEIDPLMRSAAEQFTSIIERRTGQKE